MSTFQSETCTRCSGTGTYKPYGACLRCSGRGLVHTKAGHRAFLYAKAIKAKSPKMTASRAVHLGLAFQTVYLMKQAFAPAGVPEEKAPKQAAA
jgi:RecJ-like exonuclease